MLILGNALTNRPVLSLRTGGQIATAERPIINPNNLKIEGFYCKTNTGDQNPILLSQDIRDLSNEGFVVNDHGALSEPGELVRLKEILDINFALLGKPVQTISRDKVGKVNDFAADSVSLFIQKLYVGQPMIKSFTGGSLSVDRTQIHEITSSRIIINDLLKGEPFHAAAPA